MIDLVEGVLSEFAERASDVDSTYFEEHGLTLLFRRTPLHVEIYQAEYRAKNKQKRSEYSKAWKLANREKQRAYDAAYRARKKK